MMHSIKTSTLILLISIFSGQINISLANVQPAKIFGSNMVLQKGIENTIWGQADKNETTSIVIPVNTSSTIYFPTYQEASVTENGRYRLFQKLPNKIKLDLLVLCVTPILSVKLCVINN